MTEPTNKKMVHSITLKIGSLIIGTTFWYIFGAMHTTSSWVTVPLYFYNVPENKTIKAPESVSLKIVGKRSEIRALDTEQIALHIDAQKLHDGANVLACHNETIFLPETIKMVHYSPSNPIIELCKK